MEPRSPDTHSNIKSTRLDASVGATGNQGNSEYSETYSELYCGTDPYLSHTTVKENKNVHMVCCAILGCSLRVQSLLLIIQSTLPTTSERKPWQSVEVHYKLK